MEKIKNVFKYITPLFDFFHVHISTNSKSTLMDYNQKLPHSHPSLQFLGFQQHFSDEKWPHRQ